MFYKFLLIILFCLSSSVLTIAQVEQDVPVGDLSTPKEAVYQFLYYLDEEHYDLNLAAKPMVGVGKKVTQESRDYALKLKQIFNGKGLIIRSGMIPDVPDYIDSTSGNAVYTLFPKDLPEIYLIRPILGKDKRNRNYADYWRFSPESIKQIDPLHQQVYPIGSHLLLEMIPQGGKKFLGLETWQYLAFLVLLGILILLNFIIWRLLNFILKILANTRLGQNHFDPSIIEKIAHTLTYLILSYIGLTFIPVLMLPVTLSFYILSFIRVFNTLFTVLLLLQLVELSHSYFKTIVEQTESRSDDQLLPIFIKIVKTLVIILGAIHVLDVFDVDLTALIAGLSIGGLALALAAQDTVKNLIGSVMIYADKPFKIGDYVNSGDIIGTVEEIGFRSTRIRTLDSSLISVPNGVLADMTVENRGALQFRRFNTTIGVAYYTPVELIERFVTGLREINQVHPQTKNETALIYLNNMGASSLDILFVIHFNTIDRVIELKLREEILMSILNLAKALNIHIAFPSTSVYIESMPERQGQMPNYSTTELSQSDKNMQLFLEEFKKKYPGQLPETPIEEPK